MTEDFSQLEDQLRALTPVSPSAGIERRVAEGLRTSARPSRRWWELLGFHHPSAAFGWGLIVPSATAVIAVTLFQMTATMPAAASTRQQSAPNVAQGIVNMPTASVDPQAVVSKDTLSQVQDGAASSVVYQTTDEGVVLTGDKQPARQVRYLSEDTLKWRNPRTGADIEVSYPREEVVLTPIAAR